MKLTAGVFHRSHFGRNDILFQVKKILCKHYPKLKSSEREHLRIRIFRSKTGNKENVLF